MQQVQRQRQNGSIFGQQPQQPAPVQARQAWTPEEDNQLRQLVGRHGYNWALIASQIRGRTRKQCRARWIEVLAPNIRRGAWTQAEDEKLRQLVGRHGYNWAVIASQIRGSTGQQCRARWTRCLDPNINKAKFTQEEDEMIIRLHFQLGNKWSGIARFLPGRTGISIRNRCKRLLSKITAPNLQQAVGEVAQSLPPQQQIQVPPAPQNLASAMPQAPLFSVPPQAQPAPQNINSQPAVQPASVAPPAAQPQDDIFDNFNYYGFEDSDERYEEEF